MNAKSSRSLAFAGAGAVLAALYGGACGDDGESPGGAGGGGAGRASAGGAASGPAGAAGAAGAGGGGSGAAGAAGGSSRPPEVASALLASLQGSEAYGWVGYSLLSPGDLNGDGVPDAAVASLSAGPGGRLAVFFGPVRGERDAATPDALLTGEFTFHNAAQGVAEAGPCDFDGDGHADLLLGAPFADRRDIETQAMASGDNAGRAYVVFGGPEFAAAWAPARGARLSRANVTLVGEGAYDAAGFTVGCLGDLDGDGRAEIAVGAPRAAAPGAPRAGAVYVVYGRPRGEFPTVLNLEQADAVVRGDGAYDAFGSSIAAFGDVTGDGRPDFGVGAPGADGGPEGGGAKDAGAAYVFAGGAARLAGPIAAAAAGRRLDGAEAGGRAGMSLTAAGDFDGDGTRDVLVGSSTAGAAEQRPGRAYVVAGGAALGAPGRAGLGAAALTLAGATAGDGAGLGVARAGDLDGDGRDEIVVGAPGGDGVEPGAGLVYVVKGRAFAPGASAPLGAERVAAKGGNAGDLLGEVVRGGDLDGDGTIDLMVTARGRAVGAAAGAGAAYVIAGKGLLP